MFCYRHRLDPHAVVRNEKIVEQIFRFGEFQHAPDIEKDPPVMQPWRKNGEEGEDVKVRTCILIDLLMQNAARPIRLCGGGRMARAKLKQERSLWSPRIFCLVCHAIVRSCLTHSMLQRALTLSTDTILRLPRYQSIASQRVCVQQCTFSEGKYCLQSQDQCSAAGPHMVYMRRPHALRTCQTREP